MLILFFFAPVPPSSCKNTMVCPVPSKEEKKKKPTTFCILFWLVSFQCSLCDWGYLSIRGICAKIIVAFRLVLLLFIALGQMFQLLLAARRSEQSVRINHSYM